jgi:hypothetical protein
MKKVWLLVVLVTLPLAAREQPIVLADGGGSTYSICISREASPSERHAADELQRFLEQISGARLPIVTDATPVSGDAVLVGKSDALDRLGVTLPFEDLGPEGFALKTAGRHLVIAGGRLRGTMYGVYTFLERLGCRWFAPDASRIPKMSRVTVASLNETRKPAFEYREPYFTEAWDRDWAARNKTNGAFTRLDETTGGRVQYYPFVHSFYEMIPPPQYFREHPEYFSLIDGQRRTERGQLCLTNPDVLRVGVSAVLRWIESHPEATIYSVSQNDWTGWCECDRCRRVEEEEGGAHSGPLLRYVNALAEEIEKKHPDKLIDTLAYWYTEAPPSRVRPRRNVRIRLCPIGACDAHPYEQCDRNAYFMRNLEAWSRVTNQLYIWHYNTNFSHYLLPFPDFDELAADIPMYRRYGVVGLFLEGAYPPGGGAENAELRSYVMARLLWDTNTNVDQAIDEFMEGYYGRAAKQMRACFDLLHRQVRFKPGGSGHHLWIYQQPGAPYLDRDFLRKARALVGEAGRIATDDATRRHVRKAELPLEYVELSQAKQFHVEKSRYAPSDLPALKARFETFMKDARSFGIQSLHEGRELKDDEEEFDKRIKPYSVVTLETAALRVVLAPELDARVLYFTDKRTGENLLREADPGERGYPDLGGLALFVFPDYHARACEVTWKILASSSNEITLAGTCPNGLGLRRTIRLKADEPVLQTETRVENGAGRALPVALQARAEYSAGLPEDPGLSLSFTRQDGEMVDRTMFSAGVETSGSETYLAEDRPAGEWRAFHRQRPLKFVNHFEKDDVARCSMNWSVRGENRLSLVLWSPQRTLAPGEGFLFRTDYRIEH